MQRKHLKGNHKRKKVNKSFIYTKKVTSFTNGLSIVITKKHVACCCRPPCPNSIAHPWEKERKWKWKKEKKKEPFCNPWTSWRIKKNTTKLSFFTLMKERYGFSGHLMPQKDEYVVKHNIHISNIYKYICSIL